MITYREWTEQDIPELKRMVAALHDAMRPFDENYPPSGEIIDAYFDDISAGVGGTSGTFIIAEDDGRAIGFVCFFGLMEPFTSDEDSRPFTFISDLYVEQNYRGSGVGKELISRAEARGKALGAPRVELAVHAANPAMGLYTHLGYNPRLVIMTKRLDE